MFLCSFPTKIKCLVVRPFYHFHLQSRQPSTFRLLYDENKNQTMLFSYFSVLKHFSRFFHIADNSLSHKDSEFLTNLVHMVRTVFQSLPGSPPDQYTLTIV